jgi:Raf kinase inhibitor-like YbhB/YbcL family protein
VRTLLGLLLVAAGLTACSGQADRTGTVATSSAATTSAATTSATASIAVTSPAFADGAAIPEEFTCRGAGTSPPLTWTGLPAGTASVALVVEDPDAPSGTFVHWVLTGLSPEQRELAAGTVPDGAVEARNGRGAVGWTPPCPPSGTHHYRFTVYALDRPADVQSGADPDGAIRAVQDAGVAQGTLTGTVAAG